MKVVSIIQARMTSTRLPGKVIKPIGGIPSIVLMIRRVQQAKSDKKILVATSIDNSDDELVNLVQSFGCQCYRGSLSDVLSRFYEAGKIVDADIVVRVTGDCPLVDPMVIDQVVYKLIETKSDYVTNTMPPTYPDGLDVEAFTFRALKIAYENVNLASEREHVTPFIRNHSELFKIANIENTKDLSHLRWTVDYPDDYQFVNALVEATKINDFEKLSYIDFLDVLYRNPHLTTLNQHDRNEGYELSLRQDKVFEKSSQKLT